MFNRNTPASTRPGETKLPKPVTANTKHTQENPRIAATPSPPYTLEMLPPLSGNPTRATVVRVRENSMLTCQVPSGWNEERLQARAQVGKNLQRGIYSILEQLCVKIIRLC
jgi:hypothetical protein